MLKKSDSFASKSAISAADAVSIIIPILIFLSKLMFSCVSSDFASSTTALHSLSSSTHVMNGNIILISPNVLALRIALIWLLKISLYLRQYLTALNPINGFSSDGIFR